MTLYKLIYAVLCFAGIIYAMGRTAIRITPPGFAVFFVWGMLTLSALALYWAVTS